MLFMISILEPVRAEGRILLTSLKKEVTLANSICPVAVQVIHVA